MRFKIPASTANIGPGFDIIAMSLDLYNTFEFTRAEDVQITGDYKQFNNEDNLTYQIFRQILAENNYPFHGIHINITGDIPVSRGLGSSASCILAGVIGANWYMDGAMSKYDIYKKAVELEGHCDNITSQYFGGLTASFIENGDVHYKKYDMIRDLHCTALIPDYELSTKKARAVLPEKIDREDSIFNSSRLIFLLDCLVGGHFNRLKFYLKDRLHENYRKDLIPHYDEIIKKAYELNAYGAFLSGAGPTIMVFHENSQFKDEIQAFLETLDISYEVRDLHTDQQGILFES